MILKMPFFSRRRRQRRTRSPKLHACFALKTATSAKLRPAGQSENAARPTPPCPSSGSEPLPGPRGEESRAVRARRRRRRHDRRAGQPAQPGQPALPPPSVLDLSAGWDGLSFSSENELAVAGRFIFFFTSAFVGPAHQADVFVQLYYFQILQKITSIIPH